MQRADFLALAAKGLAALALSSALLPAAHAADKVRIGVFPSSAALPFYIAQNRGYFKELGLEVEEVPMTSHPLTVQAIVHVYAGGPALGGQDRVASGTAAIDHVSLACAGYHAYRARFQAAGLEWREFLVPGTSLWQLFVYDPSGVQLELTFEGCAETGAPPDMRDGRVYRAGQSFFSASAYPRQTLLSLHGETHHATR